MVFVKKLQLTGKSLITIIDNIKSIPYFEGDRSDCQPKTNSIAQARG